MREACKGQSGTQAVKCHVLWYVNQRVCCIPANGPVPAAQPHSLILRGSVWHGNQPRFDGQPGQWRRESRRSCRWKDKEHIKRSSVVALTRPNIHDLAGRRECKPCTSHWYYRKSRKGQELEDYFGGSLGRMAVVADRHSTHFDIDFLNHQVCLTHLLRECQYLNELTGNSNGQSRQSLL